ncbi:MAG: hypothetical protein DHS80DRAFT_32333 [Piptocephalis tieghemiana]|nr:MAG: hypothetical protein DHS80DRAFT_32333 [Piptocephalis tieghemiana]
MRNLMEELRRRERGGTSRLPGRTRSLPERFIPYTAPQSSICPVKLPLGVHFLRSFSPDGQHLLCFASSGAHLQVRGFRGLGVAEDRMNAHRATLFSYLFPLKKSFDLKDHSPDNMSSERFSSSFSLFHPTRNLVLLASLISPSLQNLHDSDAPPRQRRYPSSSLRHDQPLYSVRFHCLNLETMTLTCVWEFPEDWMDLEDARSCSLEGDTLSVLSLQDQTIYLFHWGLDMEKEEEDHKVYEEEKLIEDSRSFVGYEGDGEGPEPRPSPAVSFSRLTQRLLTYIYRKAVESGDQERVQYFHQIRSQLMEGVVLTYCHLIGPTGRYLQLHYQPEAIIPATLNISTPRPPTSLFQLPSEAWPSHPGPHPTLPPFKPNSPHYPGISTPFSVLYDVHKSTILSVIHKRSFHSRSSCSTSTPASPSTTLPTSPQRHLNPGVYTSPFLDSRLFTYEDELLLGKPKPIPVPEAPMRIKHADTGGLAFSIHLRSLLFPEPPPSSTYAWNRLRPFFSFIHHPTLPLFISIIYGMDIRPLACLHLRSSTSQPYGSNDQGQETPGSVEEV